MTNKGKIYMTRIRAAANLYDLKGVEVAFKQDSTLSWEDIERLCRASDDKRYSLQNNEAAKQLKEILFIRTKAEMDAYHDMSHKSESWTKEEIKGLFVRKPYTIDDLRTAHRKGKLSPIRVIATEWLEEDEFRHFRENLLEKYPFIQRHTDETGERDGVMLCILVRCKRHREAIAVEPEGYDYARYAALVTVE